MRTHGLVAFAPLLLPGPSALKTSFSTDSRIALASPIDVMDEMDESDMGSLEKLGLDLAAFKPFADNYGDPEASHLAAFKPFADSDWDLEASPVSADATPDCWMPCGRASGRCGFCGAGHACCRESFSIVVPECSGAVFTQGFRHECVAIVEQAQEVPEGYQVDRAIYRSVTHPMLARDVTGLVNDLLKAHGPQNVTGAEDLNPIFGDVAPRESKVLRVSVGPRWRDMKEAGFGGPANKTYDISKLFRGAEESVEPPSMFITVFSRRGAATRRGLVRDMWSHVAKSSPNVDVKFALCDEMDAYVDDLQEEHQRFDDLLLLACDEGYGQGALTLKVLAAMTYYRSVSSKYEFFMKVDDDTFIAWERFYPFLVRDARPKSYIGVPIDAAIPCRNSSFRWYEPYSTFNATYFPKGMAGGPGYAFGTQLVEDILSTGIGKGNVLWNEDRAAGVWVDQLIKSGRHIDFVEVPGIDGWWRWDWRHPTDNWATWADYPYMLHHGLHGESIQCLALADQAADPWRNISHCFAVEAGEEHTPFECARQTEVELAKLSEP